MKTCKPKWKSKKRCLNCNGELGDYYSKRCRSCYAMTMKGKKPKNFEMFRAIFVKNKKEIALKISKTKKGMKQKPQCGFQKGRLHWKWKGGITNLNHQIRNSPEYKKWRDIVLRKFNFSCVKCGQQQGWKKEFQKRVKVHADHIKSFAIYPEFRFSIENGQVLCEDCHKIKTFKYEKI